MTRLKWKFIPVHLEIVLILTRDGCAVCVEHTIGSELFCTHPMELLCDVGHVKLISVCLDTVLVSVQDRCTVLCQT
jgi:hypothetical protein